MATEKNLRTGNTTMLVLKLLETQDMYGYQIIDTLATCSHNVFQLKTGTLYPLLHGLEKDGMVTSYDQQADNQRTRKYYQLTKQGHGLLAKKQQEWAQYTTAVTQVIGGMAYGIA